MQKPLIDKFETAPDRPLVMPVPRDEARIVRETIEALALTPASRTAISNEAAALVAHVRAETHPTMMESFLAEYGLSTEEGIGLMCLAEALLRVPDAGTIDELISDKIEPGNWMAHLGHSSSGLVNTATWALMLTGKVLDDDHPGVIGLLRGAVRRVGEPVVRAAVAQAMKVLGAQFVLGETISDGLANARSLEAKGYTYSYDMLGEAARTAADAERYFEAYDQAITSIAARATDDIRSSPGISIKLSALHPRYEFRKREQLFDELTPRVLHLCRRAADAGIGLNIDAEEANRLELSLEVADAVFADHRFADWEGFGVVVQAYAKRAGDVIDWLDERARDRRRRIMIRLVKGAYWDTEVKAAQVLGLDTFPVFTRKAHTDVNYLACTERLTAARDRIYGQFATHNAHTVCAVRAIAGDTERYEFQRLHGMGEALHEAVREQHGTRCRIYAPVGAHRDLLAYLVRRLLENGANSSFVNQIVDESLPPAVVAEDPITEALAAGPTPNPHIRHPAKLYGDRRRNARGYDVQAPEDAEELRAMRAPHLGETWTAAPTIARADDGRRAVTIRNPADQSDVVGDATFATAADADAAISEAREAAAAWSATPAAERADVLRRAAKLYEEQSGAFLAILAREAGKTLDDAVGEIREAVDFLRYYAAEIERLDRVDPRGGRGVFVCISPWNFPLAIFTGQIAAALAAGNAVVAKPAEQTPLIAARGVALLHEAGVPGQALVLLPGDGGDVGAALTSDPRVAGICFTGSTETAQIINRAQAAHAAPDAVLIAETGGLNAMIVDSTALPEQAVRDILASAFQSAGQRCSALRMLYVQDDIADGLLEMLTGAMAELDVGDPRALATDVGPVIDDDAHATLADYCEAARADGRVIFRAPVADAGRYVPPTLIQVSGIEALDTEMFGPVLHVARFEPEALSDVVAAINAKGYGLTFGLHTRIDDRVDAVVDKINVGNVYVNRNQIGAVVGVQPFGGEGLSGTGPKAGGPHYLHRFRAADDTRGAAGAAALPIAATARATDADALQSALAQLAGAPPALPTELLGLARSILGDGADSAAASAVEEAAATFARHWVLPGPTGETNRLGHAPRGTILCLGPTEAALRFQAARAIAAGNRALLITATDQPLDLPSSAAAQLTGPLAIAALKVARPFAAVCISSATGEDARALRQALADRDGSIVPLVGDRDPHALLMLERHLCVDTTAAGGNAALLSASETREAPTTAAQPAPA